MNYSYKQIGIWSLSVGLVSTFFSILLQDMSLGHSWLELPRFADRTYLILRETPRILIIFGLINIFIWFFSSRKQNTGNQLDKILLTNLQKIILIILVLAGVAATFFPFFVYKFIHFILEL